MSSVTLEPGSFHDAASPLGRICASRTASLLVLLALAVVVVAPGMAGGRLFPRPTPYVATMQYAAGRLGAGELPLWNPHEHFGEPVAQDGRSALWYPATIVHALLEPPTAWHVIAALHLWLAGAGAWMLAGRYGLEPAPRLMCGVTYMLCGTNVLGLEHAQGNVLPWLPWAALAVERLSERVTAPRILLASLVLAVQFLGGDLLASAALVATCTLALLTRAIWIGPKRLAGATLACAAALAVALAASAIHWVMVVWPWHATPLAALADFSRRWPWGAGPFVVRATAPALVGGVPIALALVALAFGRRPRAVVLWAAVGAALAATVAGAEAWTRFGGDAARAWPRPRVFVAGACLAVAVLAGFGIETVVALSAQRAARVRAWLLTGSAALVAIATLVAAYFAKFNGAASSGEVVLHCARLVVCAAMFCAAALVIRSQELPQWRSRGWAWVVLTCTELLAFAIPAAARGVAIADLRDASDVAAFLRSQPGDGRFVDATTRLPAALATWQSLYDAGGAGRSGGGGGGAGARHEAWSAAAAAAGGRNGSDVLRVGNVRFLIVEKDAPAIEPSAPPPPWKVVHESRSLVIYEDPNPLPRAWVAPQGRRAASPRDAAELPATTQPAGPRRVASLDAADLDPAEATLIARRPDYWSQPADERFTGADAAYESRAPEEVRVGVPAGAGGWLVVADAFGRGWRATVDGKREPIVAAFGAFRAVRLPPGATEVVFRYEPAGWHYALLVSAAGAGLMLLLLAWSLIRPRGADAETPLDSSTGRAG